MSTPFPPHPLGITRTPHRAVPVREKIYGLKRIPSPSIENISTWETRGESTADALSTPSESPDPEPGAPWSSPKMPDPGDWGAETSPDAGGSLREVGIELCLKESDGSEHEKYQKDYTLRPRCLTFLKAQLDFRGPGGSVGPGGWVPFGRPSPFPLQPLGMTRSLHRWYR